MFISAEASLTSVSFMVKPAIDTDMNTAPRRLGERGKRFSDSRAIRLRM
jgi:hypothetical protein